MHRVWGPVSLLVLAVGILYYLYLGAVFGRWTDVGVYSVVAMLVGFGAAGYWASLHMDDKPDDA
jgi:hypothetical protein